MAESTRTRTIAAQQDAIWQVLAEFGALGTWLSMVDHCSLLEAGDGETIGTTRRVQVGRNTFLERISEFDPPHALAYQVQGLPRQLGAVRNRWSLTSTGTPGSRQAGSTVVALTSTVDIGPGVLRDFACRIIVGLMRMQNARMLADLATRMEGSHG